MPIAPSRQRSRRSPTGPRLINQPRRPVSASKRLPSKYSWWRKKSSGIPYCVGMIENNFVFLWNEVGRPDGKFHIAEFKRNFYAIAESDLDKKAA